MSDGGAEITLVAKYTSYVVKAKDILEQSKAGRWSPSTTEFLDVARQGGVPKENINEVGDIIGFLSGIQVRQAGGQKGKPRPTASLRRVNLFAHGSGGGISLHGRVLEPKPGVNHPEVTIADGIGVIDTRSLDVMENQSEEQKSASRNLFVQGGGMFIYACESGMDGGILQRLADYFRVTVHGFFDLIEFCPRSALEKGVKPVRRGDSGLFYKIGETTCSKYDFHDLPPPPNSKRPQSPSSTSPK